MKRPILIIYCLLCGALGFAQKVSMEDAIKVAAEYIAHSPIFEHSKDNLSRESRSFDSNINAKSISITGDVPLYVVQLSEGWVIVTSDSVAKPILAASPTGVFPDINEMPDAMKWLLSYYESSIQFVQDSIESKTIHPDWNSSVLENNTPTAMTRDSQEEALPYSCTLDTLGTIIWHQHGNNTTCNAHCEKSYNKFCPAWFPDTTVYCDLPPVGCVALAMGMIMWYYQWPYYAYIPNSIESNGEPSTETHVVLYDWKKILPAIYNTTIDTNKINATAGLLRDCGYACKMEYGSSESNATIGNAKRALENTFQYHNISHKRKSLYLGNWDNMIRSEILSGRPVLYAGYEDLVSSGHAFIIWGYSGDKFKINWGWGGDSNDGFYSLEALDPNSYDSNGPYRKFQEALVGIEPNGICEDLIISESPSTSHFAEVCSGELTLPNYVVSQVQEGYLYSNERIRLTAGFHAKSGSKVRIAIMPVPCDENETRISSPQRIAPRTSATTDTSNDFENVENVMIQSTAIYTISGQLLQTIEGGQRDAAHLPNGMYILQHRMSDGSTRSEKIANNK